MSMEPKPLYMPAPAEVTPLIELRDVEAAYGPFRAIFGVSFALAPSKVLAMVGSNGAGKTTIARIACGLVKPTSGELRFEGRDVTGIKPYRLARLGIAHAPEGRSVFASLSVSENLELGFRRALGRAGVPAALDEAFTLFPRLGERRKQLAGTLSGGEQRMLALAKVMVHTPRLLICDELSLGLAPVIVDEVYRTLARIRDSGTALLIVEQHVRHALEIADDVAVLNHGQITYQGPVSDVEDLAEKLLPVAHEQVEPPSPN